MRLEKTTQAISSTELQRNTRAVLDQMETGGFDHYVVMRENRPAAVLMPTDVYEQLMDELADLRIETVARERVATFDPTTAISHEEMLKRMGGAS